MLRRLRIGTFRPALSFIGLLSFITSFFGSRLFATFNPTVVIQQQGIHFHHFWYGIALMGIAGWLAITWKSERLDRAYAVMYGLGAGFIGDEVGLLLTLGNYQSELTFDFFIGAISASTLLLLVIRYRVVLKKECLEESLSLRLCPFSVEQTSYLVELETFSLRQSSVRLILQG